MHRIVIGVVAAGFTAIASAYAAEPDPAKTNFVDLTANRPAQAAPEPSPYVAGSSAAQTMFMDLSTGAVAVPVQQRELAPSETPHVRHFDLSNGDMREMAEPNPPLPIDTITITADRLNDPFEDTNRGRFNTHVKLHRYVIDPVERAYFWTVPSPARGGLHNFLTNLETPAVLANDVFQGDLDRAGTTLERFVVNSTVGVVGLIDVAGRAGIPYRDNDFGATLATYGVSDYPYLLVPVIGPSNPRDLGGKVVDFLLDPLHFVTLPGGILTSAGHAGLHELDKRSIDAGQLDALSKSSPDAYAEERKNARAKRAAELGNTPH